MNSFIHLIDEYYEEMVEIRRYLHQNPELSFKEYHTANYIQNFHKELGHEVRTNVGGNGVIATLKGKKPGKTVALRADFDALPIQEKNEVSYKSKVPGVMHACGHDGHTAILLTIAKAFNELQDDIHGEIVFIHQHGEEKSPGGAITMIEDGCLDEVDAIFGTHLMPMYPLGEIKYNKGSLMAAGDTFDIKIIGDGGHGALPHLSKDSIAIASQLVVNLQQIVSRRVDPLDTSVLSIGSFVAENAFNVIAGSADLSGTVRTFDDKTRDFMEKEIERVIKGTCIAADANYEYQYTRGYPAVINHEEEANFLIDMAKKIKDVTEVSEMTPMMGGDDFAYYLQKVKGTYFITGAKNPEWDTTYPNHHPKFDIDERALGIGAKTLGLTALNYAKA